MDHDSTHRLNRVRREPSRLLSSRPTHSLVGSPDSFKMVSLLWVATITLLMVPMTTLIDVPVARWINAQEFPEWSSHLLDLSVFYSHGTGVFIVLALLIALSPKRRWYVPRLATLAVGGAVVATLTKLFILRPRPGSLYLDAANFEYAWIWQFDWTLSQVATFDPATRAFPSASLATATALTAGLWVIAPRVRWLACLLCVGTMVQRAFCGAHFTSDLFGSASVGLAWAYVCFHPSLMGAVFDRIEPDYSLEPMSPRDENEGDNEIVDETTIADEPNADSQVVETVQDERRAA
ncbi:phosphatase PAP2 family protein [Rubripirellula amarantea]|nr:phosphatase PAP2 family protein [Rubripirellula amarantea]